MSSPFLEFLTFLIIIVGTIAATIFFAISVTEKKEGRRHAAFTLGLLLLALSMTSFANTPQYQDLSKPPISPPEVKPACLENKTVLNCTTYLEDCTRHPVKYLRYLGLLPDGLYEMQIDYQINIAGHEAGYRIAQLSGTDVQRVFFPQSENERKIAIAKYGDRRLDANSNISELRIYPLPLIADYSVITYKPEQFCANHYGDLIYTPGHPLESRALPIISCTNQTVCLESR